MTTQTASEKQRRVAIQIPSRYQALLLQRWADSTGRLKGSLLTMLFEKGLEAAQARLWDAGRSPFVLFKFC